MSNNMTGSTKAVLALVAVIAIIIPIALAAVLIGGPIPLPSSTVSNSATTISSSTGSGPASTTIYMPAGVGATQTLNFSPTSLSVAADSAVSFVNQDSATHNVHFTSVPAGSTVTSGTTSPNIKAGQTYTVTLTTPGTYTYVCDFHSWMTGTITVTA